MLQRTVQLAIGLGALTTMTLMFSTGKELMAQTNGSTHVKNIVLVHGGFVDGSGWEGVYKALKKEGYTVTIVQNPTISLAGDVAVTKRAIDAQNGPVILVGHSYGGAVISEAGNDPKVVGLVYITAFALDKGESVGSLLKDPPPGAPVPPIMPPQDGFLLLDRSQFPAAFAGDVSPAAAAFMADSQVPWGLDALNGAVTQGAWRTKPSWYMVATEDKDDPARCPTDDVQTRGRDGSRGEGQPRHICVATASGRAPHREGRDDSSGGRKIRRGRLCRREID